MSGLLAGTGSGRVSDSAYDAGWVARLGDLAPDLAGAALEWLREHQLPDGTWGAAAVAHDHDRALSTLSAVVALSRHGGAADADRIRRALPPLAVHLDRLRRAPDAVGTIAFALVVPPLLTEAGELGLEQLPGPAAVRARLLSRAPAGKVNNRTPFTFSAEMARPDGLRALDLDNLQAPNGSVGLSPAATAFFAQASAKNAEALAYLRSMVGPDGGVPNVGPADVFEAAWTLWNLGLAGLGPDDRLVQIVEQAWASGRGVTFGTGFRPEDGEDTAVAYEALTVSGVDVDLEAVLAYQGTEHFYTWPIERTPSLMTNVQALSALRAAGMDPDHPAVATVLGHLVRVQDPAGCWLDKWHLSAYYATGHAVVATAGLLPVERAIGWLLDTQRLDGAWGTHLPTAEETAYALQALVVARRDGVPVPPGALRGGYRWLAEHAEGPYPWLRVGKVLYALDATVRATVLSALTMVEQEGLG